jgi:hypothetical protein
MKFISMLHPDWNERIKSLDSDTILHLDDLHYPDLLEGLTRPGYTFVGAFGTEIPGHRVYNFPFWTTTEINKFKPWTDTEHYPTEHIFNFIANKKSINRHMCMKMVEFFKLTNYDYTWSAVDNHYDMSTIIQELDSLGDLAPLKDWDRSAVLQPIAIPAKFVHFEKNPTHNTSGYNNFGGNPWTWANILRPIFTRSAVSLITETLGFDYKYKAFFTEKTAFATFGLTFPIWIGHGQFANEWERLGFDVFNDVVDHSYQQYNTIIEQCYYAFHDNLELLTNFELAKQLRQQHWDRLIKNRELLFDQQLEKFLEKDMTTWPKEVQAIVPELRDLYRNGKGATC